MTNRFNPKGRSRKVTAHTCRQTGGVPIFAGAQGCVFKPALKCKDGLRDNNDGNISKLEERASAEAEMPQISALCFCHSSKPRRATSEPSWSNCAYATGGIPSM